MSWDWVSPKWAPITGSSDEDVAKHLIAVALGDLEVDIGEGPVQIEGMKIYRQTRNIITYSSYGVLYKWQRRK